MSVIVRALPHSQAAAESTVHELGGTVETKLPIINGFAAKVPAGSLDELNRSAGVAAVTQDGTVRMQDVSFDAKGDFGSLYNLENIIHAKDVWKAGYTGKGVDVAMIDTGVVPVNGLTTPGKVVNGPDLSFDSQANNLQYLDGFGHGTHIAGIIGGKDNAVTGTPDKYYQDNFVGIAPDSRIVNVKVGNASGAVDVSQVLAAIDWVVQHRNDNGMNIKVLNLSFGTDSAQPYVADPLDYAAEVAWRKGIVVVVAAGNAGFGNAQLNDPANDPYVISVGADDPLGTNGISDDTVPSWSSRGSSTRHPDLVAPGAHVVSLRDPGSYLDQSKPSAVVANRFFRGSGTSQAAGVVSGAAALLLQQRPSLTPDQVKCLLTNTASKLPGVAVTDPGQGAGLINVSAAMQAGTPTCQQGWPTATGLGSLDQARGTAHVVSPDGVTLSGEQDIFGNPWDGASWSGASWSGASWSGGLWNGASWSGASWSGASWSGASWSGASWSGASWSGASWSGASWSGASWSGASWSGASWSGASWSGASWSGASWSGASWSGADWS
jgi:serine protease AprX